MPIRLIISLCLFILAASASSKYNVEVTERSSVPILSYIDKTSTYQQIFNPTWVEPSPGTKGRRGILARTQNCVSNVGDEACTWCGGSQDKASILTFSEEVDGKFRSVDSSSVVFGPFDSSDSWGTEDPRMQFNPADGRYYMFYTAYNGSSVMLTLASTSDPTSASSSWTRHGPVFPTYPESTKSGALLLRKEPPHYLLWGDHTIRIAKSNDITSWPDAGEPLLQTRNDMFDSQLVESGPPPLLLSSGDYLFIYNSAEINWPQDRSTAYHVGWAILDGKDPTVVKARSSEPLLGPEQAWEKGDAPYACNAPNVVFVEAAHALGNDYFRVFFGGADATVGSAVLKVTLA